MTEEFVRTDRFAGARIRSSELAGLEIRDCETSGLRIVDCYGSDVHVAGDLGRIVVNDVDVTTFVQDALDRQHPVRVRARGATQPDDYRAAFGDVQTLWAAAVERCKRLPEGRWYERVQGEWSFVETQRHLLFASDAWVGNAVLEEDAPYHPLGFPSAGMPPEELAALGLTPDASPTLDEVLAPRRDRLATVRRVLDALDHDGLARVCARKPADPYPDQEYVVRRCLSVVLKEEAEHLRYALRDLAVLEAR